MPNLFYKLICNISKHTINHIMHIFVSLLLFNSATTISYLQNIGIKLKSKYEKLDSNETKTRIIKFKLETSEINEFYDCLLRINKMNKDLIEYIKETDFFSVNSIIKLRKIFSNISLTTKYAKNDYIFEKESFKLCELFYRTTYYIMLYRRNLLTAFSEFIYSSILPLLRKLNLSLYSHRFFRVLDLIESNFHFKKMNDHDRHNFLLNLLIQFHKNQNHDVSIDFTTNNNSTKDDLLHHCYNFYATLYSKNMNEINHKTFNLQKYNLSSQLNLYLFIGGRTTCFLLNARRALAEFIKKNRINLETQSPNTNIISDIDDFTIQGNSIIL